MSFCNSRAATSHCISQSTGSAICPGSRMLACVNCNLKNVSAKEEGEEHFFLQGWRIQSSFLPQEATQKFTGCLKSVKSPRNLGFSQRPFPQLWYLQYLCGQAQRRSSLSTDFPVAPLCRHEKHQLTCKRTKHKPILQRTAVLAAT